MANSRKKPPQRGAFRPTMERLEARDVPTALLGLTNANALLSFDSATPGTATTTAVTGLIAGDNLVGIDYRPSSGVLFGVSNTSHVYTINASTGVATVVNATAFTPAIFGTGVGFDFNPASDKLRIVTSSNQSLRVNADTGVTAGTDTAPFYNATSYNDFFGTAPTTPQLAAAAYTKNADPVTSKTVTTLYDIDSSLDVLVIQGGPDGDPSPNTGELTIVEVLSFDAGVDTTFDIQSGTDAAFVATGSMLYSLNITTGVSTKLGTIVGSPGLLGLSVVPSASGAGTLSLPAATFSFPANRGPLAVTVTRTGGATGAVAINYATTDGTAIAGTDYFPGSGTLNFADGELSQTVFLSLPGGAANASAAKTFTIALSAPVGATLGTTSTATITIPAVATSPTPVRFVAVGGGVGSVPQVEVRDAFTGASVGTFLGYEATFKGGVTVATGDINGDGTDDVIVGSGLGGGPRIRVFDGTTLGTATPTILSDFFAYESTFRGGVTVAVGDTDGDGFGDVVVGSGNGGGPRVRVFDGAQLSEGMQTTLADFFAYESTFRGGVNVGSGNFNNDSFDDIIAGAGVGGGPRVRVFDGKTPTTTLTDYFAYDSGLRSGVTIAAGDINGDSKTDVITGAGIGGGPNVRAFSGLTQTSLANFFAYGENDRGGVRVATADFNDDGVSEIVTGSGPGGPRTVKFFGSTGTSSFSYDAFNTSFTGGVYVG